MKNIGCLLVSLMLISNSLVAQKKNAIRTDPVLGLILGNTTVGYERTLTKKLAFTLTGHYIRVRETGFTSLPNGSYVNDLYINNGIRGTFGLRFYSNNRLGKIAYRKNFIEPTFFTGIHEISFENKISSGLSTVFPFTESYFSEVGKIKQQISSNGIGLNIGRKWQGSGGEFLEVLLGTGYRYTPSSMLPITYIKWDRTEREDLFRLRKDVNGLFLKVSLIFGLSF